MAKNSFLIINDRRVENLEKVGIHPAFGGVDRSFSASYATGLINTCLEIA